MRKGIENMDAWNQVKNLSIDEVLQELAASGIAREDIEQESRAIAPPVHLGEVIAGGSRLGKKPVQVPAGVTATVDGQRVTAKGPKGELTFLVSDAVVVKLENNTVAVTPVNDSKGARAKWGMSRTMIQNLFKGVKDGYERTLEIKGVGYRAALQGKNLQLQLGFSHDVVYEPPMGITIAVPKPTEITVTGIDKRIVGQVAAEIREYRGPEPYKGKGVKYAGERIVRKEGKKGRGSG